MSAETLDAGRGWRRYAGHFAIAFAIPHVVSGIAFACGVGVGWFSAVISGPVFVVAAALVLVEELIELALRRQTPGKAFIDCSSKMAGVSLGLLTWTGWW